MKRDFYLDVYTILNRIQLTIWAICAFRVLNPHMWPLSKKVVQELISDFPKVPNQAKAKRDGVINPQNNNFSQCLLGNFDALKTPQINWSRPPDVPSGTPWSTSSDTNQVVKQLTVLIARQDIKLELEGDLVWKGGIIFYTLFHFPLDVKQNSVVSTQILAKIYRPRFKECAYHKIHLYYDQKLVEIVFIL